MAGIVSPTYQPYRPGTSQYNTSSDAPPMYRGHGELSMDYIGQVKAYNDAKRKRAQDAAMKGGPGSYYQTGPAGQLESSRVTPNPAGAISGLGSAYTPPGGGANISHGSATQDSNLEWQREQERMRLEADLAMQMQQKSLAATSAGKQEDFNLQMQAEARRLGQLPMFMQQISGVGGPGTGQIPFDEEAARAEAFSRAKSMRGKTAQAALRSLADWSAATGRMGGGGEAELAANVLGEAGGGINDFIGEQYIQDLNRSRQISDRNYSGDLTRRGQDLAALQGLMASFGTRY